MISWAPQWAALAFGVMALCRIATAPAFEGTFPDPYNEPGLMPNRAYVNQAEHEYIDPFSGLLKLQYVDLLIPGDGGMDLKVQRSYTSRGVTPASVFGFPGATGIGWTLHFGRVAKTNSLACSPDAVVNSLLDNPVLELPDGSRRALYSAKTVNAANPLYLTGDRWKADCDSSGNGLVVVSPEGVRYAMNHQRFSSAWNAVEHSWYVTRITDRNENWIDISYKPDDGFGRVLIDRINTKDSRTLIFSYADQGTVNVRLSQIQFRPTLDAATWVTWRYSYTKITSVTGEFWQLTRVDRPDGTAWVYEYHPSQAAPGAHSMKRVTNPYGGSTTYTYKFIQPDANTLSPYYVAVESKQTAGPDVTPGNWTFSYAPGSGTGRLDVTTVQAPDATHVYRHFGFLAAASGTVWKIGLLVEKEIVGLQTERYDWTSQTLSTENRTQRVNNQPIPFFDAGCQVPLLTTKTVVRDGTAYTTTYSQHDQFGNPHQIAETGEASKTTNLTYVNNIGKWIVHQVQDEEIVGAGSIVRTFDANGNLRTENKYGVPTGFDYHPSGDVSSITNARGFPTFLGNYKRGTAQTEQRPQGVNIARVVNDTGTVQSVTNGRGFTTSYGYDSLNRVTSIAPPMRGDIRVSYGPRTRTTARGDPNWAELIETVTVDGFGRLVRLERRDTHPVSAASIVVTYAYDAVGRKTFESHPNASTGTAFRYDALGRIKQIDHADGTSRAFEYLSGNRTNVSNERSLGTLYSYRSFGDPAIRAVMRIDAPEGVSTVLERDLLGNVRSATQGDVLREYGYDTSFFLVSETHPETGITIYGRDAVGNMTSRQVGASGRTVYAYDGLNRLTGIDYPDPTPDATYGYDANNNLISVTNSAAIRTLRYDWDDNLTSESLTVNGVLFTARYDYSTIGQLTGISYPSNSRPWWNTFWFVNYMPDMFGRPTQVSPVVLRVAYHPNGLPSEIVYYSGQVTTTTTLTSRQWLGRTLVQRPAGALVDLTYDYDGSGNVKSITNALDPTDSRSMLYDGIDRLTTTGDSTIGYDPAGNIRSYATPAGALSYSYLQNRLTGVSGNRANLAFSYDVYGNVASNGVNVFGYDDASNLRSVGGATSAGYDYDGKNVRVRAVRDGEVRLFFYSSLNGMLLGEYDAEGVWKKEYAYLGSRLVGVLENMDVKPGVPSMITVPPTSTGSHTIIWGAPASGVANRYELQQDTNSSFTAPVLVFSGNAPAAVVTIAQPAGATVTYYYRVRACLDSACSAYRTASNGVVVSGSAAPSVPPSISVPQTAGRSWTVSWAAASGNVTRYEVQVSATPDFASVGLLYSGPNLQAVHTLSIINYALLKAMGTTYYYRVRACNLNACSDYRVGTNGHTLQ